MADLSVLKEFLVRVGFSVDEASQQRTVRAIALVGRRVLELGAGVELTAAGIVAGMAKVADSFEQLYFQSRRVGSSVASIKAFAFAVERMGGTREGAQSALESMGKFLRTMPAASAYLRSLGVSTTDAQGHLRDTASILVDLGNRLAKMPLYRAEAYASIFGIDYRTLLAMRRGLGGYTTEYKKLLAATGIDTQAAAVASHKFMTQLKLLEAVIELLGQKVLLDLVRRSTGSLTQLRRVIVQNFGTISHALEIGARYLLFFAHTILTLVARGSRVLRDLAVYYRALPGPIREAAAAGAKFLLGWAALVKVLGPVLGSIVALGVALWQLWKSYENWERTGKTGIIDWPKWQPAILAAERALREIGTALEGIGTKLIALARDWGLLNADNWRLAFNRTTDAIHSTTDWLGDLILALGETGKAIWDLVKQPLAAFISAFATGGPLVGGTGTFRDDLHGIAEDARLLVGILKTLTQIIKELTAPLEVVLVPLARLLGLFAHTMLVNALSELKDVLRAIKDLETGNWVEGLKALFSGLSKLMMPFSSVRNWLWQHMSFEEPGGSPEAGGFQRAAFRTRVGAGGGRGGMTGGQFTGRTREAMRFFTGHGWTMAQAAGIVANLQAESGLNPRAFNPAGGGEGAMGIAQWRSPRIERIEAHFGRPLQSMSFEEQLEAVQWELRGGGGEGRAGAAIAATSTPYAAGFADETFYERGEAGLGPGRGLGAERVASAYGHAPAPPPAATVTAGATVTINQGTNIHVQGGGDAVNAAQRVVAAQNRVNQNLVRNFKSVAA